MQKNIQRILFACFAVVATAAVFTLSVEDSRLESLRAHAAGDTKCVEVKNSDCKSPSTGTIYNGYTLRKIGEALEIE